MDIRQNPLWLSIPSGKFFGTEVRTSVWFLVFLVFLCLNLHLSLGLAVGTLLFFSLLVHEFAHVFAARGTGGSGHEILIWPLGGLANVTPAPTFASELWTILAGPLSNGLVCLAFLPAVMSSGQLTECCSLLYLPETRLSGDLLHGLALLAFSLNFKLMVVNLLFPIFPLDSWQLAFCISKVYWDRQTAKIGALFGGLIVGVLLMLAGLYLQSVSVVFLASILFSFNQYEFLVAHISRSFDDTFMGYDFSQGYTSLERDDDRESARKPGMLESWKRQRAEKKRQRDLQQRIDTEKRLDELLEKVHQQGMASLSADERRFLQQASNRYRSPGKD